MLVKMDDDYLITEYDDDAPTIVYRGYKGYGTIGEYTIEIPYKLIENAIKNEVVIPCIIYWCLKTLSVVGLILSMVGVIISLIVTVPILVVVFITSGLFSFYSYRLFNSRLKDVYKLTIREERYE